MLQFGSNMFHGECCNVVKTRLTESVAIWFKHVSRRVLQFGSNMFHGRKEARHAKNLVTQRTLSRREARHAKKLVTQRSSSRKEARHTKMCSKRLPPMPESRFECRLRLEFSGLWFVTFSEARRRRFSPRTPVSSPPSSVKWFQPTICTVFADECALAM